MIKRLYYGIQGRLGNIVNRCYERSIRKRIKNTDCSILCPTCIGGIMYHRLGIEFKSPTINMWLYQRDFLKFVSNLKWYIDQEPVFFEHECGYPTAKLADITLFFNHSKTEEDARRDWNRRKTRINYDNLFLILYDTEDITEEDILALDKIPCRNKVVFSAKKYPHIKYVKTIKPTKREFGKTYLDKDGLGIRTFEKKFDFVEWLNS